VKCRNGLYGYMDLGGEIVIEATFQRANDFNNGLALAQRTDHWGYIDQYGNWRIPNQYQWAGDFSEELAPVWVIGAPETYQFIDTSGNPISQEIFDEVVFGFSEGFAGVRKGSEFWFIDRNGKNPFERTWTYKIGSFRYNLARVKRDDGNFSYIDSKGQQALEKGWLIEPGDFYDGFAWYQDEESYLWGFIDIEGNEAIPAQFDGVTDFSEGFAAYKDKILGKWGFIDTTGKIVIKAKYEAVQPFSEELAATQENGLWGYINSAGTWVITPRFNQLANSFRDGIAKVTDQGVSFYITTSGQKIEIIENP
jgi:hypothetical protein